MRPFPAVILILSSALACAGGAWGEDRTERIEGSPGWRELDYRDGRLVSERSFGGEGELLSERDYSPEALPILTKKYLRANGRLLSVEASDAAGAPVGKMSYRYDRNGRLLSVLAEGSFGDGATGVVADSCVPQGAWIESKDSAAVLAYDDSGRAILLQDMDKGAPSRIERRSYSAEGRLEAVDLEDKASGTLSSTSYDEKGRAAERKVSGDKVPGSDTKFAYDGQGRLAEETTRTEGGSLSVKRVYGPDGKVARTETRKDGLLVLAVSYAGEQRVEELYDEGELFVKSDYEGGVKVKDSFYAAGVLVRERSYR